MAWVPMCILSILNYMWYYSFPILFRVDSMHIGTQAMTSTTPLSVGSHITLQPKTGGPLKLSRVEPGHYLDGRPPGKTSLLLEEMLVRPAGGAQPVVCVGPNTPV